MMNSYPSRPIRTAPHYTCSYAPDSHCSARRGTRARQPSDRFNSILGSNITN
jgi:hypothetical protein